MDRQRLTQLLAAVQGGACSIDEALARLRDLPFEDLGFANIDHHRALRNGFPEVIFGEGKTVEQMVAIAERMAATGASVLITRLAPAAAEHVLAAVPGFAYNPTARNPVRRVVPFGERDEHRAIDRLNVEGRVTSRCVHVGKLRNETAVGAVRVDRAFSEIGGEQD